MDGRIVTGGPDLDEVRRLFVEYAEWVAVDLSFQGFAEELAGLPGDYVAPRGTLLLGLVDGRAAGCIAVRPWMGTTCEMKRLFVRSDFRGTGLGKRLASEAVHAAVRLGYGRMVLDTLESMTAARNLYTSLGFEETEAYYRNPLPGVRYLALDLRRAQSAGRRPNPS